MPALTTKHLRRPDPQNTIPTHEFLAHDLNDIVMTIHQVNVDAGWWHDMHDGKPLNRSVPELLCLVHSEISEAMEGDRRDLMDDKLPQYKMFDVELVDTLIRLADMMGARTSMTTVKFGEILQAKLRFNAERADHKAANRKLEGGKKY